MRAIEFHSCLAARLQRFVDLLPREVPITKPRRDCCCTSIAFWRSSRGRNFG